ncbi:MAG: DNA topoisomerase IB [Pyrinomonadaceae bacterium]
MTRIEQLQQTGLLRKGTPRNGFRYQRADGRKVNGADLERIRDLRIPPAWKEVAINPSPGGKLQAIGKDAAGRWQYLYHKNHVRAQEARKFSRLIKFGEALPKMRTTVSRQLKQTDLGRDRVMSGILRILSSCFMRPGSQVYASENGSYGVATLRRNHVKVKGDVVEFDFPGKSGVRQQRDLKDRQLARVVRDLLKHPGAQVFKYQNGDNQFVKVTTRHINEYVKNVMGNKFSAKDFRTWAGTLVCACALARTEAESNGKGQKTKVTAAIKETATILGNTPAVCRSAYICPEVIKSFDHGKTINGYFKSPEDFIGYRGRTLHQAEKALLRLLKQSAA